MGEDLVKIYDVPDPSDKDPSKWVLFSFALFFSIIVADAGYGLIFLGLSLFMRWKFFKKAKSVILQSINPAYPPLSAFIDDDLEVAGVVTGVVRKFQ